MLYAPKLSMCSEAQEIKETGNEEIKATSLIDLGSGAEL